MRENNIRHLAVSIILNNTVLDLHQINVTNLQTETNTETLHTKRIPIYDQIGVLLILD